MTARQLYDLYCDERWGGCGAGNLNGTLRDTTPVSWRFLPWSERQFWSRLAAKLDKKPRKRKASR